MREQDGIQVRSDRRWDSFQYCRRLRERQRDRLAIVRSCPSKSNARHRAPCIELARPIRPPLVLQRNRLQNLRRSANRKRADRRSRSTSDPRLPVRRQGRRGDDCASNPDRRKDLRPAADPKRRTASIVLRSQHARSPVTGCHRNSHALRPAERKQ